MRKRSVFLFLEPFEAAERELRMDDTVLLLLASEGGDSQLWEWYGFNGFGFSRFFGAWDGQLSLAEWSSDLFQWERRSDLLGLPVRVTVLHWDPVSVKLESPPGQPARWTGMLVEIMEGLQAALNFTLVYSSPEDGLWGGKVRTC